MLFICSLNIRVLKLRFFVFSEGPGGFRELREAGRNQFHLSWYLSEAAVAKNPWGDMFTKYGSEHLPLIGSGPYIR